jgi:hypothetical protein
MTAAEAEHAPKPAALEAMPVEGRHVLIKLTRRQLHVALAKSSLKLDDVNVDAASIDRNATSADMRIEHGMTECGVGQHSPIVGAGLTRAPRLRPVGLTRDRPDCGKASLSIQPAKQPRPARRREWCFSPHPRHDARAPRCVAQFACR